MRGSACWGVLWSVRENPSENPGNERGENRGKNPRGKEEKVVGVVVVDRTKGKDVHLPWPFQEPTFEATMENTSTWLPFGSCVPTRSVVVMCRSFASSRLYSHDYLPHFPPPIHSDTRMEKN